MTLARKVFHLMVFLALFAMIPVTQAQDYKVETKYYPSKKVKDRFRVDDQGRPNGFYDSFYEETMPGGKQRKKGTAQFRDGQLHGSLWRYYPTGRVWAVAYYNRGKLHGEYSEYDPNSKLVERSVYRNGVLEKQEIMAPKKPMPHREPSSSPLPVTAKVEVRDEVQDEFQEPEVDVTTLMEMEPPQDFSELGVDADSIQEYNPHEDQDAAGLESMLGPRP